MFSVPSELIFLLFLSQQEVWKSGRPGLVVAHFVSNFCMLCIQEHWFCIIMNPKSF